MLQSMGLQRVGHNLATKQQPTQQSFLRAWMESISASKTDNDGERNYSLSLFQANMIPCFSNICMIANCTISLDYVGFVARVIFSQLFSNRFIVTFEVFVKFSPFYGPLWILICRIHHEKLQICR